METVSKVKITIIRHAESEFNAGIPGADKKPNCPLSEHGKKQASQIKGEFDLVICSPLQRAQETFLHSQIQTRDFFLSHLCREIHDGNIINLLAEEIGKKDVEQKEEIQQRIDHLRELIQLLSKKYQRICLISHFCFLSAITKLPWINNAEMFEFEL